MQRLVALLTLVSFALLAGVVWAQGLPTAKPEEVGLSSERLERVSRALRSEIEAGKIPGAVALVARKGRVVYFESFGVRDKATGEAMPKDAIFRLYSMTKPFTSVAAMMLMEDGKLLLTDPVSKFLPQLAKREVNTQQLDPATGKVSYVDGAGRARDDDPGSPPAHVGAGLRIVHAERADEGAVREGRRELGRRDARRADRAARQGPARPPAGDDLGVQPVHRRAGPRGREDLGCDARPVLRRAHLRAAEDDGHRVRGADGDKVGRLAQPLAVEPSTGKPIKLGRRHGAAQERRRRRGQRGDDGRLRALHARCCSTGASSRAPGC